MAINDFLAIGIVGTLLSIGVEYLQSKYGLGSDKTKFIAVVGSIVLGTGYVLVQNTAIFPTIILILGTASTIFALFFNGNTSRQ